MPTHSSATAAELLNIAIAMEQSAEAVYLGMAACFAHYSEIAEFWEQYAAQETAHASWLAGLQKRLSADVLAEPVDPQMLEAGRRVLATSPQERLSKIDTLDDALELADELEHSEMNAIFEFLIGKFAETTDVRHFLRSQLREHVERLISGFPAQFQGKGQRTAIKALTRGKAE